MKGDYYVWKTFLKKFLTPALQLIAEEKIKEMGMGPGINDLYGGFGFKVKVRPKRVRLVSKGKEK